MNLTISAEIERIVKVAQQELADTVARLHKEMGQLSTDLKKETGEKTARYVVWSKREADMGVQIIRFIKPHRKVHLKAGQSSQT